MAELISKISKGSKMDQIYIPKERSPGFETGTFVLIRPALEKAKINPFYYNVDNIEPIKIILIQEILSHFEYFDNAIITGSFLEIGFDFEENLGINVHIISVNFKTLLKGISTDPLFQMLTSKLVSKKRVIFKIKNEINYKLLDLQLLKSELLIINFHFLTGREKYKFVRNLFAIILFLDEKSISPELVDNEINKYFGKDSVKNIKENLVDKSFLARYEKLYENTFKRIMKGVKNGSKQKQAD